MSKIIQGIMAFIVSLIIIIGFAIMLSGFVQNLNSQPITVKDVYQYVDHDAQIVCYILENGNGISCLPMSEVNLNE